MNDFVSKPEWNLNTFSWVNEERLPGFGKLLVSWLSVHRNFCAGISPEHSWEWQYTERPHIGFLSNAAVLIGGIALEEWGTEKVSGDSKGHGRNDLWLHLCPPSKGNDYYIEAKHARLDLQSSCSESGQKISQVMINAGGDAKRLNPQSGRIAAISFFTLRFTNQNIETLDKQIKELLIYIQTPNDQINYIDAIGAIWLGSQDFQLSRKQRDDSSKGWTNDDVGLILLASRIR